MSAELLRKIKAVLFIAMLAGAEARRVEQNVRLSTFPSHMEAMMADAALQDQLHVLTKQMGEMKANPELWERSHAFSEQMEAMMANPSFRKYTHRVAQQIEAMEADPNNKEQLQRVVEQIEEMLADPDLQEQTERVVKQMETSFADPTSQQEAELVAKQMEAIVGNPELQEQLEQTKAFAEQVGALATDPTFQEHTKRFTEQMETMMADPNLQEQASLVAKRMEAMEADQHLQEQAKRIAEQVEAMRADPNQPEQAQRIAELAEVALADPKLQELGKGVAQQIEAMMADQNFQEQTKSLFEGQASSHGASRPADVQDSVDRMVKKKSAARPLFTRFKHSSLPRDQATGQSIIPQPSSFIERRFIPSSLKPSYASHGHRAKATFSKTTLGETDHRAMAGRAALPTNYAHGTTFRRQTQPNMALTSVFASEGVQKALSFFVMGAIGTYLRPENSGLMKPEFTAGVQTLMLQTLVPALVFKSLASVTMSTKVLAYPAFGAGLVLFQFAMSWAMATAVYGRSSKLSVMRRSTAQVLWSMAPALSSFAFIKEFVGSAAVGTAALIDLPNKFFVLIVFPVLLKLWAPAGGSSADEKTSSNLGGKLKKALTEPFNVGILGGLAMAATGTKLARLGPVGTAVTMMADAVTPVLFLLLGLKLNIKGSTPALCATLLFLRHGAIALAMSALFTIAGPAIAPGTALALTVMSQSAVSVVGVGQLNKAVAAGVPGYTNEVGFDLLGYSFPFTTLLTATACVLGPAYIKNLHWVGMALLTLGGAIGVKSSSEFRDPKTWSEMIEGAS